ncbi:hypothetical protein [Sulfuritalea sp.]|uniref:hypothetical protein n=1 Tax=Sulfuritalea sp. TaxID=2480090 RepID=UPI001AC07CE2|nr:hypothetical protein [Sulfuritalea sp.]MBN8473618.1 hypothetical protein [Sulfuritalea sp.]
MKQIAESLDRLLQFLFPPYALWRQGPSDDAPEVPDGAEVSGGDDFYGKKSISSEVQKNHLMVAEKIHSAEQERKKTIEDKAANFFVGATLSSGILAALPTLLTEKLSLPLWGKLIVFVLLIIAAIYLIGAAIYATKVRGIGAFYVLSNADLEGRLFSDPDFQRKWAVRLVELTRLNQPTLTRKSNQLWVAEQMFLRGVISTIISGGLLGLLAIGFPPSHKNDLEAYAVSVFECRESNASLAMLLAAEGKALGVLEAKLSASLEAQEALKVQMSLKKETATKQVTAQSKSSKPKSLSSKPCGPERKTDAEVPAAQGQ